jgi:hypothetical protein
MDDFDVERECVPSWGSLPANSASRTNDFVFPSSKKNENPGASNKVIKVHEISQRFIRSYRPETIEPLESVTVPRTEPVIDRLRHGGYAAQKKSESQ